MGLLRTLLCLVMALTAAGAGERYAAWDKLYIKPDVPMKAIAPEGTITLLLYHQYPDQLHNVRAVATSDELALTSDPQVIAVMPPTDIQTVKLHAKRRANASGDTALLAVSFTADELPKPGVLKFGVPLTTAGEASANAAQTVAAGEVQVVVVRSSQGIYIIQILIVLTLLAWMFWRKKLIRAR